MNPYYQDGLITIYHGDNRDVLPTIKGIDLVATDPLYGVTKDDDDDLSLDFIPLAAYALKNDRPFFTFCGQATLPFFWLALANVGLTWRNTIVWHYENGFSREETRFCIEYDPILFFMKGTYSINTDDVRAPYKSKERLRYDVNNKKKQGWKPNPLGAKRGDVWSIPAITSGAYTSEKVGHKWQKPEVLMNLIIRAASNVGDVVLDPFLGSGTTLVAAKRYGRHGVGIEIDEQNCELAAKRLVETSVLTGDNRGELVTGPQLDYTQHTLF